MLVSTKGRYALRVMVDLAEHQRRAAFPSKRSPRVRGFRRISGEHFGHARARQYALGMRGKGGGYVLTRPPEQYTVGEILRLTEGSLAPVACLDGDCKGCSRSDECPTLGVWKNLDKLINDYLDGVTLDALVAPNEGYDYVI